MCVYVFHAQTPAKLCRMPWSLLPSCKRVISWAERLYAWFSDSCDMFWDVCWSLWKQQNKGCILDSFWFMAALPARALTMTLHFMSSWVHKSCCYRIGMVDRPLGCNYVCTWNASRGGTLSCSRSSRLCAERKNHLWSFAKGSIGCEEKWLKAVTWFSHVFTNLTLHNNPAGCVYRKSCTKRRCLVTYQWRHQRLLCWNRSQPWDWGHWGRAIGKVARGNIKYWLRLP